MTDPTENVQEMKVLYRVADAGGQMTRTQLARVLYRMPAAQRRAVVDGLVDEGLLEAFAKLSRSGPPAVAYKLTAQGSRQVRAMVRQGKIPQPEA